MRCTKCKKAIPNESVFCMFCGYTLKRERPKRRSNGAGTIRKRGNRWYARVTIGFKIDERGIKHYQYKEVGGFKTEEEADNYRKQLSKDSDLPTMITLRELWTKWEPFYSPRVGTSTMNGYRAAYKYLSSIENKKLDKITANMLQMCIDKCEKGHRTKQMIKVVSGLLMKYAIDERLILINPAANLYIGHDGTKTHEALTDKELERIKKSFESEPYAKYVYALCYLGFRPTEMFELKKIDFHGEDGTKYLVGGIKTEAGKDRIVTIPPVIESLIDERMAVYGTEYLFPRITKKDGNIRYEKMTESYFRKSIFCPMMKRLGIEKKVPYSTRHTYADKIKKADGADRDKAALIGHSDYGITQKYYQSTSIADRKEITDQLK